MKLRVSELGWWDIFTLLVYFETKLLLDEEEDSVFLQLLAFASAISISIIYLKFNTNQQNVVSNFLFLQITEKKKDLK